MIERSMRLHFLLMVVVTASFNFTACGQLEKSVPLDNDTDITDDDHAITGDNDQHCTLGTLGCECDEGQCNDSSLCEAGMCTECPQGTEGCPCISGDICSASLVCKQDICNIKTIEDLLIGNSLEWSSTNFVVTSLFKPNGTINHLNYHSEEYAPYCYQWQEYRNYYTKFRFEKIAGINPLEKIILIETDIDSNEDITLAILSMTAGCEDTFCSIRYDDDGNTEHWNMYLCKQEDWVAGISGCVEPPPDQAPYCN